MTPSLFRIATTPGTRKGHSSNRLWSVRQTLTRNMSYRCPSLLQTNNTAVCLFPIVWRVVVYLHLTQKSIMHISMGPKGAVTKWLCDTWWWGCIQIIVSCGGFIAFNPSRRPRSVSESWCFSFTRSKRWEVSEPPIHPCEDPHSNFQCLNLKSRLHPSPLHIWLSRCLQDGLLYCLNSCVASNAANLCHRADLLLSVHASAGEYPSEMNAGVVFFGVLQQCGSFSPFHKPTAQKKS